MSLGQDLSVVHYAINLWDITHAIRIHSQSKSSCCGTSQGPWGERCHPNRNHCLHCALTGTHADEPPGSLTPPHCLHPPSSHFYHLFSASPQSTSLSIHVRVDVDTFPHSANHCRAHPHSHSRTAPSIGARIRTEHLTLRLEMLSLSFTFSSGKTPGLYSTI